MFPLLIFGPVVAPLVVAILVFIVIAAITGTLAATTSMGTSLRVGLAFLIGGLAAAKAHSWAKGQVDVMLNKHEQLKLSAAPATSYQHVQSEPATGSMPAGGLPPINIPENLMPR